ncbi:hypothetical protein BGW38_004898 [Lunasporangiospora selenospora]|uniref:Uncharacterized protein n=1 Tax=Lunasporangiospora selenospora TaxID=979761 RepID=A0A9P6KBQ1_9FUNG|nr:hypothetical protein BGW38_004898 [Lunasporangiospora selenospora]
MAKSAVYVNSDIESSDDEVITSKSMSYQPPAGFSLHKPKKGASSDFDISNTSENEVWLIRVPEGITNEDLSSIKLKTMPPTSGKSSHKTVTLGTLKKKDTSTTKYALQTITRDSGFAQEVFSLCPLFPTKAEPGHVIQASSGLNAVTHHLALVVEPTTPAIEPLAEEILSRPYQPRDQPEGLKMRFQFAGSQTQVPGTKLSGSGKQFAARWAETLEKRRKQEEEEKEARLREEQEQEEAEAEENDTAEEKAEEEKEEVAEEVDESQLEEQEQEKHSKKRKNEDAETEEVDAKEEKKHKKEKKEKKEKKHKKDKKESE